MSPPGSPLIMACTFKPGHAIFCKTLIQMIYAAENELIYINIYNMEAFFMPKFIYFQIICEIKSFITWLEGGLKVT